MTKWKEQIKFIEFNMYMEDEEISKNNLLEKEINFFHELMKNSKFWKTLDSYVAKNIEDGDRDYANMLIHKCIEKETGWLVDNIQFTDGTEHKDSMFYLWKYYIDRPEDGDEWNIFMIENSKNKLTNCTYDLRGWDMDTIITCPYSAPVKWHHG